jgi:hypothetical protein
MRSVYRVAVCALLLLPGVARASVFYSVNVSQSLLTYDTVGNLLFSTPMTGFSGAMTSLAVQPGTGTLFGETANGSSDFLVTIDPNTGTVTSIGTLFSNGSGSGMLNTTNLAFLNNGHLYMGINDALYEVDLLDASLSLIGGTSVAGPMGGGTGLTLWLSNSTSIMSVDPSTGNLTQIGTTVNRSPSSGLTGGPASGYFYFLRAGLRTDTLDSLDPSFNESQIATLPSPPDGVLAYAPSSFTPEPTSLGLLGAGVVGLFAFRKYWK